MVGALVGSLLPREEETKVFTTPPTANRVVFNLANEPALKYSLQLLADQGPTPDKFTSTRLIDNVLYLESFTERYELCAEKSSSQSQPAPTYAFARVAKPHSVDRATLSQLGAPMPQNTKTLIADGIDWEELQWGTSYLRLRGVDYSLANLLFVPRSA